MGFLDKLFNKKKHGIELTEATLLTKSNNIQHMKIHEDLNGLLWLIDGPQKNYISKQNTEVYTLENGLRLTISISNTIEPSAISTKLPIHTASSFDDVERPPYFPTYSGLTSEQRGKYWKFLENPYDSKHDIGYVFILYYGLERHLLEGDYEKAYNVILKLRDVHTNKSFQSYSGCALVLTAMLRQKPELIVAFCESLDKEHEYNFSDNLYLLCKSSLGLPLLETDLMKMAKTFEFTNSNYIKKYPSEFVEVLKRVIHQRNGENSIDINSYITKTEWRKMKTENIQVFANVTLSDTKISVPLISECFKFKKEMFDILEEAHKETKAIVSNKRKDGTLTEHEPMEKASTIITFDFEKEKELLNQYEATKDRLLDRHFVLIQLQEFYYKYREIDRKYLNLCIDMCNEDIAMLPKMQESYKIEEEENIRNMAEIYSEKEISKKISEISFFEGNIPAFKRLVIIFEKSKNYNRSIQICESAIAYYESIELYSVCGDFRERIEKLIQKINK